MATLLSHTHTFAPGVILGYTLVLQQGLWDSLPHLFVFPTHLFLSVFCVCVVATLVGSGVPAYVYTQTEIAESLRAHTSQSFLY